MERTSRITKQCVIRVASFVSVTAALLCPLAWSAPGDLDPTFGEIGRVTPSGISGQVRSIRRQGDRYLLGGGETYPYFNIDFPRSYATTGFVRRIDSAGVLDGLYAGVDLKSTYVTDFANLANGSVIAVGRSTPRVASGDLPLPTTFMTFRLGADGMLDPAFGAGGFASAPQDQGLSPVSVVLDDRGNVVIAGSAQGRVTVMRLLPTGMMDESFGFAGLFQAPETPSGWVVAMLRTAAGYRLAVNQGESMPDGSFVTHCQILALSDDGAPQDTFGDTGHAELDSYAGAATSCEALSADPQGRLIAGGQDGGGRAFVVRLLAGGQRDSTFAAPDVKARMTVTSAVAVAPNGSVLVAGRGETGVLGVMVVRLGASGALDTTFGSNGIAWIDLPVAEVSTPRGMVALDDGRIVVAGGMGSRRPFVARLVGGSVAESSGVISMERGRIKVSALSSEAVVSLRRTGGALGTVTVAYRTPEAADTSWSAIAGQDYVATTGRLSWADGERGSKQIVVPLLPGMQEAPGSEETFAVQLYDIQGGALAADSTTVAIDGLSIVQLDQSQLEVVESSGSVSVNLYRQNGTSGAISLTLRAVPGTAAQGTDYQFETRTVEWADGDASPRQITIPIVNDRQSEPAESFTVRITSVSSGAVIGEPSVATIQVVDDDRNTSNSGGRSSSGGGQFGFLSLLLLGLASTIPVRAKVAELVDALDLGSSG